MQGAVPGSAESVLPDRRAREAVDVPVLSVAEPVPATLQGHFDAASAVRAQAGVHDDRVHALALGDGPADLLVRR